MDCGKDVAIVGLTGRNILKIQRREVESRTSAGKIDVCYGRMSVGFKAELESCRNA